MLFKVSEESSVREVLQARGVVCHDVGTSWDEEVCLAVAVFSLVSTGVIAEKGSRPVRGDRSLQHSRQGGGVVSPIGDGGVADVVMVSHEGGLSQETGLLKVAVGDVTPGVVGRDQPGLDLSRERLTPEVALAGAVVVNTPHPCLCRIRGAQEGRLLRHDLGKVGGAVREAGCEGGQSVDVRTEAFGDADAAILAAVQS